MNFSKYARIGKAPFTKAIGVQKNHKEVIYTETQELDCAASGCFSCENYQKYIEFFEFMPPEIQEKAKNCCANCPHAVYKTVVHESYKYINEKNMFGFAPRLKSIALKLLLIYHFSNPDEHGLVCSMSPKELAAYLHCTVRSIKNANNTLQKYGYIMYCNDGLSKNHFNVLLTEYSTYALPADQGGRGYATFNQQCLDELVKIKNLNQLRISLRVALDIDTKKGDSPLIVKQSFESLRRFLPQYCKPGVIKNALSATNLFKVAYDEDNVLLQMYENCHGRRNFDKETLANGEAIKNYVDPLNQAMDTFNKRMIEQKIQDIDLINYLEAENIHLKDFSANKKQLFVPFDLSPQDYKDLGILTISYTVEEVKSCLQYIHTNYISNFKLQSIGALARTILQKKESEIDTLSDLVATA
ncbi:MAG: hypothetical protein PHW34_09130 [Hespellia sp.]|nr:hypothetical protein [Hespellia sp.]